MDEIAGLTLLQVSNLSKILMKRLGIKEMPPIAALKPREEATRDAATNPSTITLYRGIIFLSKLYPSRVGHFTRSANVSPTELTKKSTLRFNFSSESIKNHGNWLHNSEISFSKPKLLKHWSFRSRFSFLTPCKLL